MSSASTRPERWRRRSSSCPKAIAGLRRTDPKAQEKLVNFLVANREVMSYVA